MNKKEDILNAVKKGMEFIDNHKYDNAVDEFLSAKEKNMSDIDIKINNK